QRAGDTSDHLAHAHVEPDAVRLEHLQLDAAACGAHDRSAYRGALLEARTRKGCRPLSGRLPTRLAARDRLLAVERPPRVRGGAVTSARAPGTRVDGGVSRSGTVAGWARGGTSQRSERARHQGYGPGEGKSRRGTASKRHAPKLTAARTRIQGHIA